MGPLKKAKRWDLSKKSKKMGGVRAATQFFSVQFFLKVLCPCGVCIVDKLGNLVDCRCVNLVSFAACGATILPPLYQCFWDPGTCERRTCEGAGHTRTATPWSAVAVHHPCSQNTLLGSEATHVGRRAGSQSSAALDEKPSADLVPCRIRGPRTNETEPDAVNLSVMSGRLAGRTRRAAHKRAPQQRRTPEWCAADMGFPPDCGRRRDGSMGRRTGDTGLGHSIL
jgi:hypothetical protein